MPASRSKDDPRLGNPLRPASTLQLADDFDIDDVIIDAAEVRGVSGRGGRIRFSLLRDVGLGSARLAGIKLCDVVMERVDLTATDLAKAKLRSVRLVDCRCLGASFAEAQLTGVTFSGCTVEMSNFRFASLERVTFERCDLRGVDFGDATLTDCTLGDCRLDETDFREARLARVDLRSSNVEGIRGLAGLHGATMTTGQVVGLAHAFAAELGIEVID